MTFASRARGQVGSECQIHSTSGIARRIREFIVAPVIARTIHNTVVYKICPAALWRAGEAAGLFTGAAVDLRDGYIHLSARDQVAQTAALHFAGQDDLLLIAVDADALGDALKWEPSRGGALFPHLYGNLPLSAVRWVKAIPIGTDGRHVMPALE